MISIKVRGPVILEGTVASLQKEYPLGKRALWIGRGEELLEKENEHNDVLNLGEMSKSVSRVHSCLLLSPAFWLDYESSYPSYFSKLGDPISNLPGNLIFSIWQFLKPAKKIILKDVRSKTGIFQKVTAPLTISTGSQIVLGDSRPLIFRHRQIYNSYEQLTLRINQLKEQEYSIINSSQLKEEVRSFWIMSFRHKNFILVDSPCQLTIGRASSSHIIVCEASISRRHATLEFSNNQWTIYDGDGKNLSSNGVWLRVRKMHIDFRSKSKTMNGGQSTAKIGDILLTFDIKEDYSHLNLSELCLSRKISSTNNESFSSMLKKQMEQLPLVKANIGSEELYRKKKLRQEEVKTQF